MLDELLILGPPIKEEYHFQIVPLFLSMVGKDSILPAQGTTYRFSVHKGQTILTQAITNLIKIDIPSKPTSPPKKESQPCPSRYAS